ncbi:MAG: hypothetical protein J5I41_03330 [Saprospiraceae bacterium]|nr:hypothetical protein [Saprospiraceae bacterium]
MKKALKVVLILLLIGGVVLAGAATYIRLAKPDVGEPPQLTVERTPERIARGEYLAHHVMLCMDCHARRDWSIFSAPPIAGTIGTGGERFDQTMGFPGVFYSRNITPAGIQDWTDGELFRLITTGVRKDGEPIFPVMPYLRYGQMDPEDIYAVIAYIRTLPPIEAVHPASEPDFPFSLILRTIPQPASPTTRPSPDDKVAYGGYLVNAAACGECHTKFEGGKFTGRPLAGGREFVMPDGGVLRTANLTPHETGLKGWSSEMFVQRFKSYNDSTIIHRKLAKGEFQSIMPWTMYAGMDTTDLEAIYAYLRTVPPVHQEVVKYTPPAH